MSSVDGDRGDRKPHTLAEYVKCWSHSGEQSGRI